MFKKILLMGILTLGASIVCCLILCHNDAESERFVRGDDVVSDQREGLQNNATVERAVGCVRKERCEPDVSSAVAWLETGVLPKVGDIVPVKFFDDKKFDLHIASAERTSVNGEPAVIIQARSDDCQLLNSAYIVHAGKVLVSVDDFENSHEYTLSYDFSKDAYFSKESNREELVGRWCGTECSTDKGVEYMETASSIELLDNGGMLDGDSPRKPIPKSIEDQNFAPSVKNIIDVLILYDITGAAKALEVGGMVPLALSVNTTMNNSLCNSGLSNIVQMRIKAVHMINYNAEDILANTLKKLDGAATDKTLYNIGISLCSSAGADLVSLFVDPQDTGGVSGIATLGETYDNGEINLRKRFTVLQIHNTLGHTYSHELAHNMGCEHSRDQELNGANSDGYYTYACGCNNFPYATIMSYGVNTAEGMTKTVPLYSGPDVFYNGVPLGSLFMDNKRKIREMVGKISLISSEKTSILSKSQVEVSWDEGGFDFQISVPAGTTWSISTSDSWIVLPDASKSGSGERNVSVELGKNNSGSRRVGTITVTSADEKYSISVVQDIPEVISFEGPNLVVLQEDCGEVAAGTIGGWDWKSGDPPVDFGGSDDFLSVRFSENGEMYISASKNDTGNYRFAYLTLGTKENVAYVRVVQGYESTQTGRNLGTETFRSARKHIYVSASGGIFSNDISGGERIIAISFDCEWLSRAKGSATDIVCGPNSGDERSGAVTYLSSSGTMCDLVVTQLRSCCSDFPQTIIFPEEGGSIVGTIYGDWDAETDSWPSFDFVAVALDEAGGWLKALSEDGDGDGSGLYFMGGGKVMLTADANNSGFPREKEFMVMIGEKTIFTIRVVQSGGKETIPELSIETKSWDTEVLGGTSSIPVELLSDSAKWTAESSESWLQLETSLGSGTKVTGKPEDDIVLNAGVFHCTSSTGTRTAVVTLKCGDTTREINVTQSNTLLRSMNEGTITFPIENGGNEWSAAISLGGDMTWLTFDGSNGGSTSLSSMFKSPSKDKALSVYISKNTTGAERKKVFYVSPKNANGETLPRWYVNVVQESASSGEVEIGEKTVFKVTPNVTEFAADDDDSVIKKISVSSNKSNWMVYYDNIDWLEISIDDGNSWKNCSDMKDPIYGMMPLQCESKDKEILVRVNAKNTSASAREALISVMNKADWGATSDCAFANFYVRQAGSENSEIPAEKDGFETWCESEGVENIAGADPAGDGVVNLLKYAFGKSPTDIVGDCADISFSPADDASADNSSGTFTISFPRDSSANDIEVHAEKLTDFSSPQKNSSWEYCYSEPSVEEGKYVIKYNLPAIDASADCKEVFRLRVSRGNSESFVSRAFGVSRIAIPAGFQTQVELPFMNQVIRCRDFKSGEVNISAQDGKNTYLDDGKADFAAMLSSYVGRALVLEIMDLEGGVSRFLLNRNAWRGIMDTNAESLTTRLSIKSAELAEKIRSGGTFSSYTIRAAVTLEDFFGSADKSGFKSGSSLAADSILIHTLATNLMKFYVNKDKQWTCSGSSSGSEPKNVPLFRGEPFVVTRKSSNEAETLYVVVFGEFPTE